MAWAATALGKEAAPGWAVVPVELASDKPEVEPPRLLVADWREAARRLWEEHQRRCGQAEEWLRRAGVPEERLAARGAPRMMVTARPQRWCGLYSGSDHACHYVLGYAMRHLGDAGQVGSPGERYETTVAHEVAHAYQRALTSRGAGGGGHGGDFLVLMDLAMGEPLPPQAGRGEPGMTHVYDPEGCRVTSRAVSREVARAAAAGELALLPYGVTAERVERRGLA